MNVSTLGRAAPPTGSAGASTDPSEQRFTGAIFTLWLAIFLIKHIGSSWDIAWHFRYPFGVFEPPHIINIGGSALAALLIVFHTMTGRVVDRVGLYLMQGGFVFFIISAMFDILNHFLFGLDVTVWSPTHVLTFASTAVVMCGVFYSMWRLMPAGRWRLALGLGFAALLLDDMLFQLSQQEYGVVAIDAYLRGVSSASPELLALAGRNPIAFAEGGIPHWVYPLWLIGTSTLVLVGARRLLGWRWAATITALLYLGYRALGDVLWGQLGFPHGFIPVMLIGAAALIDLAEQHRWPPLILSLGLVVLYYTSALLIDQYTLMPRFAIGTAPAALLLLWGGLGAAHWIEQRRNRQAALPAVR